MEASYGAGQTFKLQPFTKKVNGLQPKTISAKKIYFNIWEDPKEYQFLLWWILPQILTTPLNLKIWCRTPASSLITHPPHPTIKLPRIQILKTGFRKLSILSKFWEWRKWQEMGGGRWGHLVCVIMTHCVRKSICDSPLIQRTTAFRHFDSWIKRSTKSWE